MVCSACAVPQIRTVAVNNPRRKFFHMPDLSVSSIVRVDQLSKHVEHENSKLDILHDISFDIKTGESIAIVGSSGSGKSTLLGLMAGLDAPSSGSVTINDIDLFNLNEDGRADLRGRSMGFVFQSFQLLPMLTALENVMLPIELLGGVDARSRAQQILERVGLGQRFAHYPRQLSGGEQQRVAIARAFVTEPTLLLADEPTGNLDSATGAKIIELLFNLNRERGTTLILVTHDAALAQRCSQTLHLDAGRLVAAA